MPYRDVVELALYDPDHGFYSTGGRAGRRGDFITSVEVGPLFGLLVGELIDREWDRLGRPDPFSVVDAGAGPGTLARSVLAADLRCRHALDYVAVERSAIQRELHPDGVRSIPTMPESPIVGLVLANELLDNLTFSPTVFDGERWRTLLVDHRDGVLIERVGDVIVEDAVLSELRPRDGDRAVRQDDAIAWIGSTLASLRRGRLVVIDYCRDVPTDVAIRTYDGHGRGGDPLAALGTKDITVDLDLSRIRLLEPTRLSDQADWLAELGIEQLVDDGRRLWDSGAATGSLAALAGRSRIREAEALTDRDGLGGFKVIEWMVDE